MNALNTVFSFAFVSAAFFFQNVWIEMENQPSVNFSEDVLVVICR